MRFLLVFCLCYYVANSSALAQQTDPNRSIAPAPAPAPAPALQTPVTPPATPQNAPVQTAPQPAPGASQNLNDQEPAAPDDLDLDSTQSFDFDDSDNYQYASTSNLQSSIASNSNFRGASPQMIGDFGGGSTLFTIGGTGYSNYLSVPIPLAGGSRRIKIAENNQVRPLDRVYGTFNYYHNSSQVIGLVDYEPVTQSESQFQYTVGFEKTFFCDYFSVDVRMPFTGGLQQTAFNDSPGLVASGFDLSTSSVGNLSTTIKAYLLQAGETAISGGLQISIPTGSGVDIVAGEQYSPYDEIEIDNDAVHLMPFIGVYRPFGKSWWLQAFTQIDTPTNGNNVRTNGMFQGLITEQTLLYSDVSLGKWLYRNRCNSPRCGGRGVTGIASVLELHYTGSLNNADGIDVSQNTTSSILGYAGPGYENRIDVLNLTIGLQTEFSELWRINLAYVTPLKERRFDESGGRQENRFFDGEFSIQVNRFF